MSLIHHEKTQITLDTETGLMWQDDIDSEELKLNYFEAQKYCKNMRLGEFSDWEIPDASILLNVTKKHDYKKNVFKKVGSGDYWTSSLVSNNKYYVGSFLMNYNKPDLMGKNHLKCIRKKKILIIDFFKLLNYKIFNDSIIVKKSLNKKRILFLFDITSYDTEVINKSSIVLSSLEKELYYLKYDSNEYFGFFHEIFEKIKFPKIENCTNLSEIINQRLEQKIKDYLKVDKIEKPNFDLRIKDSFIKDEFESQEQFDKKLNQFIEKQKREYEQRELEYKKRVENLGDIKKDFLSEIFAQTMGIPILRDAFYDAEINDMYMTLFMTNCLWEKRIKVNIPNRTLAKDFKTKLNEVKIDVTFNLENEEFIFDKVELEFDNNKFIAEESKEQEKQEEIKIDFKLVTEEPNIETLKDTQLPKYALEVKTLDNQKLEDEIISLKNNINLSNNKIEDFISKNQILEKENHTLETEVKNLCIEKNLFQVKNKELETQLQVSENRNQTFNYNNQIVSIELILLKKLSLDFENLLKVKDDEIINLKNNINLSNKKIEDFISKNQTLETEVKNLCIEKNLFQVKNKELETQLQVIENRNQILNENRQLFSYQNEELKKSNLKFENVIKIKDDEIMNLKSDIVSKNHEAEEKYQNILKDHQVLKYEIEELKKYCKELELNDFQNQEQQNSSKVVKRESFSDF